MEEASLFDLSGRTRPQASLTLNSLSRMMEARPGKPTGSPTRNGSRANPIKHTEQRASLFSSLSIPYELIEEESVAATLWCAARL